MHPSLLPFPSLAIAAALIAAPALGPPTICHPIDIGDARSLPWGDSPFSVAADYDVGRAVEDTLAILRESSDTLVHMETLRRAAICLADLSEAGAARPAEWRQAQLERLQTALQADVAERAPGAAGGAEEAARGLRIFDLGYLEAVLLQSERHGTGASRAERTAESRGWLDQAAALRPDDGALQLGFALALYDGQPASTTCYAHLERAVALATDPDGLLRRNLLGTMGRFLGASSYDDLAAKVGARERA